MFRIGLVTGVDEARAMARVQFDDMDGVLSYWLPVLQHKTCRDKSYWMPDAAEHVVCLLDEHGEEGAVLGAIYSDADGVPTASTEKFHVRFSDGATVEYDRQEHLMAVYTPGDIRATAGGGIEATAEGGIVAAAPTVRITGQVSITGDVSVTGGITATGRIIDTGGNTNHHSH